MGYFILSLTEEKRVEEKKGEFLCPTGCRLPPLPRRMAKADINHLNEEIPPHWDR
jgi:hypothetical protein